ENIYNINKNIYNIEENIYNINEDIYNINDNTNNQHQTYYKHIFYQVLNNTATSSKSSKTQASSTTDGDEIDEDAASLESGSAGSHAEINGATSSSSSGSSLSTAAKVGASVGGSVGGSGIICVFAFVFVSRRRRKHQKAPDNIVLEAEAPPSEAGDLELGGTNEEPSPSEESPAERVSIERPAAFDRQTLNPQINHIELPPHYDDLPENKVTAVIDIKEKD
ncbi:hypothetical protein LPJ53_006342, partial [Coemansia erecta]